MSKDVLAVTKISQHMPSLHYKLIINFAPAVFTAKSCINVHVAMLGQTSSMSNRSCNTIPSCTNIMQNHYSNCSRFYYALSSNWVCSWLFPVVEYVFVMFCYKEEELGRHIWPAGLTQVPIGLYAPYQRCSSGSNSRVVSLPHSVRSLSNRNEQVLKNQWNVQTSVRILYSDFAYVENVNFVVHTYVARL